MKCETGFKPIIASGLGGNRVNSKRKTGITIPMTLAEAKVVIFLMNEFTRFVGTRKIAGINHNINVTRVEAIAQIFFCI